MIFQHRITPLCPPPRDFPVYFDSIYINILQMIFPISSRFQFMISALYYKYTTMLPCMALSNWHCGLVSAISFVSMVRLSANVNTPPPSPSIFAPALSFVFPCVCVPVCISYHHCVCHIRAMSIINTNVTEMLYNTIIVISVKVSPKYSSRRLH